MLEDLIAHGTVLVRLPCIGCNGRGGFADVGPDGGGERCEQCQGSGVMEVRASVEELIEAAAVRAIRKIRTMDQDAIYAL